MLRLQNFASHRRVIHVSRPRLLAANHVAEKSVITSATAIWSHSSTSLSKVRLSTERNSKNLLERDTHLRPNFDSTQINEIFADITSPNFAMQQNMYAYNIYRRLLRIGYEAKLVKNEENFSHIKISADDDYFIEITPVISKDGTARPLMEHHELSGDIRKVSEELFGTPGLYSFQAIFTLKYNTYDAELAEELGIDKADTRDETTVGTIQSHSYDFFHFVQGALYDIAKKFDTEVYPEIRSPRRKNF